MATSAPKAREEFIYLIGSRELPYFKIGYTTGRPESRIPVLQTGFPLKLELVGYWPGGRALESWLHVRFMRVRTYGEWFKFKSPDSAYHSVDLAILEYGREKRSAVIRAGETAERQAWERRSAAISAGRQRQLARKVAMTLD